MHKKPVHTLTSTGGMTRCGHDAMIFTPLKKEGNYFVQQSGNTAIVHFHDIEAYEEWHEKNPDFNKLRDMLVSGQLSPDDITDGDVLWHHDRIVFYAVNKTTRMEIKKTERQIMKLYR